MVHSVIFCLLFFFFSSGTLSHFSFGIGKNSAFQNFSNLTYLGCSVGNGSFSNTPAQSIYGSADRRRLVLHRSCISRDFSKSSGISRCAWSFFRNRLWRCFRTFIRLWLSGSFSHRTFLWAFGSACCLFD